MSLRVVQVNCVTDPLRRDPDALLDAWPTLPMVAEATTEAGAEVIVVQASHRNAAFNRCGVQYQFVQVPQAGRPMAVIGAWRLANVTRQQSPDVIHFNGLDFPVHARALSALRKPVLVQDHASLADRPRLRPLRRWGHARVAAAAFTARALAEPFLATGQLPPGLPIFAVPESSSRFTVASRHGARQRTRVTGDPAVLWVGHLNGNKDPLTFFHAAASALDRLPKLELWLVFIDDELLPDIEAFLNDRPELKARTHLLGRLPHKAIEELCRACDLFVSTSHRESTGYALIEAMACGLPPVVSDIPSFREMVGDGGIGALVSSGDHRGFAKAIIRVAGVPQDPLRKRIRAHFDGTLSTASIGKRLVEAYGAIAHGRDR